MRSGGGEHRHGHDFTCRLNAILLNRLIGIEPGASEHALEVLAQDRLDLWEWSRCRPGSTSSWSTTTRSTSGCGCTATRSARSCREHAAYVAVWRKQFEIVTARRGAAPLAHGRGHVPAQLVEPDGGGASLGARQSPRGESEPPEPTLGAFGIAVRLNWLMLEEAVEEDARASA